MTELTVNGTAFNVLIGPALSIVISSTDALNPWGLQEKCGECFVGVVQDSLGSASTSERKFLDLMDRHPSEGRLLCQYSLNSKSVVNRFEG